MTIAEAQHKNMLDLNSKTYPNEILIGAFVTKSPSLQNDIRDLTDNYFKKDFGFNS